MSSVIIAGDTSGSVTLQAPTSAGSTVVNLPSVSMNMGNGGGNVATNTAFGAGALGGGSQTGGANTGIGYQALYTNTNGSSQTAVGAYALGLNSTGIQNAATGYGALYNNTTGSYNTANGYQALQANTTASYNTAVGYQAGYSNTTGYSNTLIGFPAGYSLTTGYLNTFVGKDSGYYVTTGAKNSILGAYNGNQGGLDIRTASNYIVLSDGDGNPNLYLDNNQNIFVPRTYLNTTATAANMVVGSNGGYARSTSALKYKQDIRELESMDINSLRPVRYKSKCENDDQTKDHLGLIADEAADAGFEELVTRGADGEVEGFQYERLTVVLLKAMQTLKAEFDAYKASHP